MSMVRVMLSWLLVLSLSVFVYYTSGCDAHSAPAPLPKKTKYESPNPQHLCGKWRMGWCSGERSTDSYHFDIELKSDGSYRTLNGTWVGTWKLAGYHVEITERTVYGGETPSNRWCTFRIPCPGHLEEKIPQGMTYEGTNTWMSPPIVRVTD